MNKETEDKIQVKKKTLDFLPDSDNSLQKLQVKELCEKWKVALPVARKV